MPLIVLFLYELFSEWQFRVHSLDTQGNIEFIIMNIYGYEEL